MTGPVTAPDAENPARRAQEVNGGPRDIPGNRESRGHRDREEKPARPVVRGTAVKRDRRGSQGRRARRANQGPKGREGSPGRAVRQVLPVIRKTV